MKTGWYAGEDYFVRIAEHYGTFFEVYSKTSEEKIFEVKFTPLANSLYVDVLEPKNYNLFLHYNFTAACMGQIIKSPVSRFYMKKEIAEKPLEGTSKHDMLDFKEAKITSFREFSKIEPGEILYLSRFVLPKAIIPAGPNFTNIHFENGVSYFVAGNSQDIKNKFYEKELKIDGELKEIIDTRIEMGEFEIILRDAFGLFLIQIVKDNDLVETIIFNVKTENRIPV